MNQITHQNKESCIRSSWKSAKPTYYWSEKNNSDEDDRKSDDCTENESVFSSVESSKNPNYSLSSSSLPNYSRTISCETTKCQAIKKGNNSILSRLKSQFVWQKKSQLSVPDANETPSEGNTPQITKATPMDSDVSEEQSKAIDDILGESTFIQDYRKQLFKEELKLEKEKKNWYNQDSLARAGQSRKDCINWVCQIGMEFKLNRSTIYRGIYYFDRLCSQKSVNVAHMKTVAATCLLIAIKWNEKEEKVPSLHRLARRCDRNFPAHSFKSLEIKILGFLDFQFKVVLPIDFVNFFIAQGVIFSDDVLDGHCNLQKHPQSNIYIQKFAVFFLDVTCQDYRFWKYCPSLLAAVVIVASRKALKIEPYFNSKLTSVLGTSIDSIEMQNCFEHLWQQYRDKFPKDAQRAEEAYSHSIHNNNDNTMMEIE